MLKEPHTTIAVRETSVCVEPRSRQSFNAEQLLGRFYDVAYAYRFGPPQHDIVIATWRSDQGETLGEAFHFVSRKINAMSPTTAVEAASRRLGDGSYCVTLHSTNFLHTVRLHADGFLPDDNYFHLPPGRIKRVVFRAIGPQAPALRATVEALNLDNEIAVPVAGAN